MRYREFRDYLTETGKNEIDEWLHSLPETTRFDFQQAFRTLEQVLRPNPRYIAPVKGHGPGLWEVRLKCTVEKIQWRPLAFYGPRAREMTLLTVARIRDNKFDPKNVCKTAKQRRGQTEADPIRRTCEHNFD